MAASSAWLRPLLEPRSIAIVGASERPGSFGRSTLTQALANGFKGEIYPVNPNQREILGLKCYPSLAELPRAPDLAVLAVANSGLEAQTRLAIETGCGSATIFASAYLEGDHPPLLAERLGDLARHAGLPVCGANCMGFFHPARSVNAGWYPAGLVPPGPIGLITHSGSLFLSLAANDPRIGYSLIVSPGQELTVTAADYMHYMLEDGTTRVIALFLETVRNPASFIAALEKANARDIPVVAVKVGKTAESARLARSHSGAIAGDDAAYEALFEKYGVLRARIVDELMATALLMSHGKRVARGGVAAVLDSGGARGLFIDLADELGVPIAKISAETEQKLRDRLDYGLEPVNPVDAWGTGHDATGIFRDCLQAVVDDPASALGILMTDVSNDEDPVSDDFAQLTVDVSEKTGKPIIMAHHWTHLRGRQILARIGAKGVLSIEGTETLFLAIRHAFAHRDFRALPPLALPPPPAPAILARWRQRLAKPEALDEAESLALLADFGIANPGFAIAGSASEAVAAAGRMGLPVALKTAMPGIHHKSEVEGVRLGLATAGEAALAYEDLTRRLGPRVIVAAMAKPGIELALGLVQDSQFGPIMMVGAGGTLIEVLRDRRVALPPLDSLRAMRLLDRLRLRPLLDGHRRRPAADLEKLALAIARFSLLAASLGDLIGELDVNPLIAGADGVVAVDALVLPRAAAKES
ncbi:MAG TPA: acetate--CoA ligase family protein [Dongiaceae bacterium]|nr:acetate--CoA ligase family protein [Dongiaceae bacterium]